MKELELLAPARNAEIGIAAIDCGADAVYMAAESFGARKDAGNPMSEVAGVCEYAHRYGARVFLTVNTIIYDDELKKAHRLMLEAQDAGVDGFIVQDLAVTTWDDIKVPLHASTQCAIRGSEKAVFYRNLGFSRVVLERETSLEDIRKVSEALKQHADENSGDVCEIEYFVHGALCVCYSGQCYMSEKIAGRSANRGACIQACRSLYDLVDESGKVIVRNKALLSLKDYRLKERIRELADAGVCSFKIEGRLKNASYVKNVVREYSLAMDELIAAHPDEYCRASYGRVSGGFEPHSDRTFNRGYTELYLDGKRGKWSSMDAPKSMGESIGSVRAVRKIDRNTIEIVLNLNSRETELHNGDGFAFPSKNGIIGFRGDVCQGNTIRCKAVDGLAKGSTVFRNINAAFERELERNMPKREISVALSVRISGDYNIDITARSEDGREILSPFKCDADTAENKERQMAMITEQLSKRSDHYKFSVEEIVLETSGGKVPLLSASILNSIRRLVASDIDALPCGKRALATVGKEKAQVPERNPDYRSNVANSVSRELYSACGAESIGMAYELEHPEGAELMRTKYCIRHELGMCPVHQGATESRKLYLVNNGQRFGLVFDCRNCEMAVVSV